MIFERHSKNMFLSNYFCGEGPQTSFFSGFPDCKSPRFERNGLEIGGVQKADCKELKEELLQLEDEYEALHHKQALTFDKKRRDIIGMRYKERG